jgi:hypothetical protein
MIVPDPYNPQAWDRYSYALNNPIRYADPSGHVSCAGKNWDDGPQCFDKDGKPKNIRIPEWDKDLGDVRAADKRAAIKAYVNYLSDPGHFASLYINPREWVGNAEVAALDVFAQYTNLHSTAENLVLKSYSMSSADLLRKAQMSNAVEPGSVVMAGGVLLYRAMSDAEYQGLMATGQFTQGPNSMGGKWFAESAANARQWGEWFYGGSGNYHVVSVELNTDLANSLMRVSKLDGIGPARYAEDLQALNGGVISIGEVPK